MFTPSCVPFLKILIDVEMPFSFDYMHVYMHVVKWLFSHIW